MQDVVDLRDREFGATGVATFANWNANLTGSGTAERVQGIRVTANAFAVLRVDASFRGRRRHLVLPARFACRPQRSAAGAEE